jgi:alkanesulfonate monooxygenase
LPTWITKSAACFGVTVTLSYEPPLNFARRMTTLDHLTEGRIGWNIVTGYLDSAARGAGRDGQRAHDDRYAVAEEYMDVVYDLWEASWADDAVIRDKDAGIYARPERVRAIDHRGEHFRVNAYHLGEPSPQRTPVLYQAGTSPAGRVFAGRHAECVFISGPSKKIVADRVASIRLAARDAGRTPSDILIFTLLTAIVASSDGEARARREEYRRYASIEGALTLMSGWTGVDFSRLDLDQVVEHVETDAGRSALENVTRADPSRRWTVREVAEHVAVGGIGPALVGSPQTVADGLESWVDDTGVDGFNLAFAVRPETFVDVVNLLVPELQRRGRYKRAYAPGTLREKLFAGGPRLSAPHPAADRRWLAAPSHESEPA